MTGKDDKEDWQAGLISSTNPRLSQSLEIGLLILQTFTPARPWMGIADIADKLKMSRSTTHRYVITLQALECLEQGANRKYRLARGAGNFGTAMLDTTGLASLSLPFLRALRNQVGHTVSLAILDRDSILYAARIYSHSRGQYAADEGRRVGSRVPASCSAMGKVLIAGLPTADRQEWVREVKLRPRGPNTIVRKAELQAELERVGGNGYAVNNEELVRGMVAIAAPLKRGDDVNVAIGIAANANVIRAAALIERCCDALLVTSRELAEHLDYDPRMVWRNT